MELKDTSVHIVLLIRQFNQATEKTLESIKAQNYPTLALSLVDISGSGIKEFANHTIHSSPKPSNLSSGVNLVLQNSDSDYILLITDGIIFEGPDVVKSLVEEVANSEAAVVGAKLVKPENLRHLVEIGVGVDRMGAVFPLIPYGELDQGQYDEMEQVFAVSKDVMLIERETLKALDGFDERIGDSHSDIDFCWRVNLAGKKVNVAPKVLCLSPKEKEAARSQFSNPDYSSQLRMIFSCYSFGSLFSVVPRALLVAFMGVIGNLFTLSPKKILVIFYSWLKITFTFPVTIRKRSQIGKYRYRYDSAILPLLRKSFLPISLFLRDGGLSTLNIRKLFHGRGSWLTWVGIVAVLIFGSRHLITQNFPQVGELLPFQSHFFEDWSSSYQSSGLGSDGFSANAGLWLSILHIIFFGADSLARTVFLLAPFFVGAWGVWYLLNQIAKHPVAKVVGVISYLLMPIPYIALSKGDLDALILYACAPWIFAFLVRHLVQKGHLLFQSLILGLIVGFIAGFTLNVFALLGLLIVTTLITGFLSGILNFKSIGVGIVGAIFGAILNFTYLLTNRGIQFWEWRPTSTGNYTLTELLSFDLAGFSFGYLIWGFVGVVFILLLIAKEERSMWVVQGVVLYLGGVILAWTAEQGWHSFANAEVLLLPSALGLALALGVGVDALSVDASKKFFGYVRVLIAVAVLAASLPVLALSLEGRWDLPKSDFAPTYEAIEDSSQRVLWIGHPDVIGVSSWQLTSDTAFSITLNVSQNLSAKWAPPKDENVKLVEAELSRLGSQDRIGGKLSFFGISHIILVEKIHPTANQAYPLNANLVAQFESQLDLIQINSRDGIRVFQNEQVIPIRSNFPAGVLVSDTINPVTAVKVLKTSGESNIAVGDFYLADASSNWDFEVEGQSIEAKDTFGWASQYAHAGGSAQLTYNNSSYIQLLISLQVLIWLVFMAVVLLQARKIRERA